MFLFNLFIMDVIIGNIHKVVTQKYIHIIKAEGDTHDRNLGVSVICRVSQNRVFVIDRFTVLSQSFISQTHIRLFISYSGPNWTKLIFEKGIECLAYSLINDNCSIKGSKQRCIIY